MGTQAINSQVRDQVMEVLEDHTGQEVHTVPDRVVLVGPLPDILTTKEDLVVILRLVGTDPTWVPKVDLPQEDHQELVVHPDRDMAHLALKITGLLQVGRYLVIHLLVTMDPHIMDPICPHQGAPALEWVPLPPPLQATPTIPRPLGLPLPVATPAVPVYLLVPPQRPHPVRVTVLW